MATVSSYRRKRGSARGLVTRLSTRIGLLESAKHTSVTIDEVRRITARLQTLTDEFKLHHDSILELVEDETLLAVEQEILEAHEDTVSNMFTRLDKLAASCNVESDTKSKLATKRLEYLEKEITTIRASISALPAYGDHTCLLQQQEEKLRELKQDLSATREILLSLDLDEASPLSTSHKRVNDNIFSCSLDLRKLLYSKDVKSHSSGPDASGVRLPKLDVPTFDGDILHWSTFWEQFVTSVDSRKHLSKAEKLVYLQHAVKNGSAISVIQGLSQSGEQYTEAVECLRSRYDRPRLVHQMHVRKIMDIPRMKEGNGKEIRLLHDTALQHLRALRAMGHEPSGSFITSLLELKLDSTTMFEWQQHSRSHSDVPHYEELLTFINLRAQAAETLTPDIRKKHPELYPQKKNPKQVTSFTVTTTPTENISCLVCKSNHLLHTCPDFKALGHENKMSVLKTNNLCSNCLRPGHYSKACKSHNRCRICHKPHHTLIHVNEAKKNDVTVNTTPTLQTPVHVSNHATMGNQSNVLLMTCRVNIKSPNGSAMESRALLDSGSSASFISERLVQSLQLPRSERNIRVSGVACLTNTLSARSTTSFLISSLYDPTKQYNISAVIVPQVTCDLPLSSLSPKPEWSHLSDIKLADPTFDTRSRIDLLLGVEVYTEVMCSGRRLGSTGIPHAFETHLGWVVAGNYGKPLFSHTVSHHVHISSDDDLLRKFWELESGPHTVLLSPDEKVAVTHFQTKHYRDQTGMFIVPLPRKQTVKPLGESRSQAIRRFLHFERSLHSKNLFSEFQPVIEEYFQKGHAELVPDADLLKPPHSCFYMPMHAVRKESSSTTKIRAVFDASAKSSTGVSLNDTLLVGPTVHASLVDVLLRFRQHRVALIADVSRMYRAVALPESDRDMHRFVWRTSPNDCLKDYRMTRVTFGVSSSAFVANMCIKQNATDHATQYPLAAAAVLNSFYVDDGLTGADSIEQAIELHNQLQVLFATGGFLLRKWNSSESAVLEQIDPELRDIQHTHTIIDSETYTKTLGVEWNSNSDQFRLMVADIVHTEVLTKRALTSDIAKVYDALGWIAPATIKAKILLQRLWEEKIQWDDPVPEALLHIWLRWRTELKLLTERNLPRCYFPKDATVIYQQLHGFSDASELAYSAVLYLRQVDSTGAVHIALVAAKTKVAPIKRQSIPRLELCGAVLLAQLLHHCQTTFELPLRDTFAWTDSTIVLNWLAGNPRRFKAFVGNRVSQIVDLIPSNRWHFVEGTDNPADCASRGLFASELITHDLWWSGPHWLASGIHHWPKQPTIPPNSLNEEADEICVHTSVIQPELTRKTPLILADQFSSYTRLKRVTAWIMRFIKNCQTAVDDRRMNPLTVRELDQAHAYWITTSQHDHFSKEINRIKQDKPVSKSSSS